MVFYKLNKQFNFDFVDFLLTPFSLAVGTLQTVLGIQKPDISLNKDSEVNRGLIRGGLIAVPLLIILTVILMQADPVFNKLTFDFLSNIGERLIVSLIIFIGLFITAIAKLLDIFKDKVSDTKLPLGKFYELALIIGGIVTLFALFIIIQFQYLFSIVGERELHKLGIQSLTFSEYINKGFFELLVASTIAGAVIVYILRSLHKLTGKQKKMIQILAAFLTLETGLLLLSAAKRDLLYADAHGLTRARIFGFIFLIWLGLMLVIFLMRVFKELDKKVLFVNVSLAALFAILSINFINIDGLIATTYKPTVNKEVDYVYITNLSTDGYKGWKEAVENSKSQTIHYSNDKDISADDSRLLFYNTETLDNLYRQTYYLINKYGNEEELIVWHKDRKPNLIGEYMRTRNEKDLPDYIKHSRGWQSFNYSEYQAYRYIIENKQLFLELPKLYDRSVEQKNAVPPAIQELTPIDRSLDAPLTN